MAVKTIALGGEAGDLVYGLPSVKALGGAHVVCPDRPWNRPDWSKRCLGLKRLCESQDYIHSLNPFQGQPIDIDLTSYRAAGTRHGELIPLRIARWARVKIDVTQPWLEVDPDPRTNGRIIVNRAPRWVGVSMPWKQIVQTFQKEILFIGMDDEYRDFCAQFGTVERFPCRDLLDVAQAIKGSELLISAQSSPYAVAEGMKHPAVLEVCLEAPDVMFPRPNVVHYISGVLKFSACGKDFEAEGIPYKIDRFHPPKGGYRVTIGTQTMQSWDFLEVERMARAHALLLNHSLTIHEIREMIERESCQPIPNHLKLAA